LNRAAKFLTIPAENHTKKAFDRRRVE
jgi:hypothetical protein